MRFLAKAIEDERHRQEEGFKRVPFDVLCSEYGQLHLPLLRPRTQTNYLGHLGALKGQFGDRYIDEIRKCHIAQCWKQRQRGLAVPVGFSPPAQGDVTGPGVASGSISAPCHTREGSHTLLTQCGSV